MTVILLVLIVVLIIVIVTLIDPTKQTEAFWKGSSANKNGKLRDSNPYHEEEEQDVEDWYAGWDFCDKQEGY